MYETVIHSTPSVSRILGTEAGRVIFWFSAADGVVVVDDVVVVVDVVAPVVTVAVAIGFFGVGGGGFG